MSAIRGSRTRDEGGAATLLRHAYAGECDPPGSPCQSREPEVCVATWSPLTRARLPPTDAPVSRAAAVFLADASAHE